MGTTQNVAFTDHSNLFTKLEKVGRLATLSTTDRDNYEAELKFKRAKPDFSVSPYPAELHHIIQIRHKNVKIFSQKIWSVQKYVVTLHSQTRNNDCFSNCWLGPLAQLNRASDYGSEGCRFESCTDHQKAILRRMAFWFYRPFLSHDVCESPSTIFSHLEALNPTGRMIELSLKPQAPARCYIVETK